MSDATGGAREAMEPSRRARRTKRVSLGTAGVGVVAVAAVVIGASVANAGDPTARFSVNANGASYGSVFDASAPDKEPDLIAAIATNGREGYVYETDLEPPELQPASPTEAGELREARDRRAAETFVRVLGDKLGVTIVATDAQAVAALGTFDRAVVAGVAPVPTDGATVRSLANALGVGLDAASGYSSDSVTTAVKAALEASSHANERVIPVYQSDGTTQVGTFTVG